MVIRLTLLVPFFSIVLGCSSAPSTTTVKVEIGSEQFQLELAPDNQSREQGLMHRTHIAPNEGMLFVFPNAVERSFWMKNCLIDIDLIFLDSRGTVTAVHSMVVEPPIKSGETELDYEFRMKSYWSYGRARFAIELSAGSFQRLGVHVNDHITLDLPSLKRLAR